MRAYYKTIIQRAKLSLREVETLSRHFEIYQVLSQSGIGPEKYLVIHYTER